MKKILILLFLIGIFVSCGENKNKGIISTTKMELRQLISKEVTTKSSSGSFFIIMGGYSSNENQQDIIKMFVKVDNTYYKLLRLNLEDVNVIIDNEISKPYLIVTTESYTNKTDEKILQYIEYGNKIYLHCPEKYLPEKLLNIELN